MPKMIKIGEVRVLNHFDLSWTEPAVTQPRKKAETAILTWALDGSSVLEENWNLPPLEAEVVGGVGAGAGRGPNT